MGLGGLLNFQARSEAVGNFEMYFKIKIDLGHKIVAVVLSPTVVFSMVSIRGQDGFKMGATDQNI